MTYQLSETDMSNLQTFREQISLNYSKEDALKMIDIIDRALLNGWLDKNSIYELLDVLPRIIPSSNEKVPTVLENQNTDWNEYIDEHRARYRREMEHLHQVLSNWVFMQSAVYRKNMESLNNYIGNGNLKSTGQGIK